VFAAQMAGQPPDALVPAFMIYYLPAGLRGLLLAAILAAAMSSIDSAMNSLAAVTLEDVCGLAPEAQNVWVARGVSFGWGMFAVGSGLAFARTGAGVLELVNQIGSAFYGPVLAVFVLGAVTTTVGARQVLTGLAAGLAVNGGLALVAPGVSWLWWNPAGFVAAVAGALAVGRRRPDLRMSWPTRREALVLLAAFAAMMTVVLGLTAAAGVEGRTP
jgi:Na+/proline symporter